MTPLFPDTERHAGIILVCFVGAMLVTNPDLHAAERMMETNLSSQGVSTLVLRGGSGAATVTADEGDTIRVQLQVEPHRWTGDEPWRKRLAWFLKSGYDDDRALIEAIDFDVDVSRGRLVLSLNPDGRTRRSRVKEVWSIVVPKRLALDLRMEAADVEVSGIAGGITMRVDKGEAEIDVPGGDLDIGISLGGVKARTKASDIKRVDLRSRVGDTDLWLNGLRIDYPNPPGPGSKVVVEGKGSEKLRIHVENGDVSLRVD